MGIGGVLPGDVDVWYVGRGPAYFAFHDIVRDLRAEGRVAYANQFDYDTVVAGMKIMVTTPMQNLERSIYRLEAKYGSENRYVKDLKEQLRAMKANSGKTAQEVYRMSAVNFSQK